MLLDTVRVSQPSKEQLVRLKGRTGNSELECAMSLGAMQVTW